MSMSEIKIPRCLHCGQGLQTMQEIDDGVCNSCKTSLYCDEDINEE